MLKRSFKNLSLYPKDSNGNGGLPSVSPPSVRTMRKCATYSECSSISTFNIPEKSVATSTGFTAVSKGIGAIFGKPRVLSKGISSSSVEVPDFKVKEDPSFWIDHNVQHRHATFVVGIRIVGSILVASDSMTTMLDSSDAHASLRKGLPSVSPPSVRTMRKSATYSERSSISTFNKQQKSVMTSTGSTAISKGITAIFGKSRVLSKGIRWSSIVNAVDHNFQYRHGTTVVGLPSPDFILVAGDGMTTMPDPSDANATLRKDFRFVKVFAIRHAGLVGAFAGSMNCIKEIKDFLHKNVAAGCSLSDVYQVLKKLDTDKDSTLRMAEFDLILGKFETGGPIIRSYKRSVQVEADGSPKFYLSTHGSAKSSSSSARYIALGDGKEFAVHILKDLPDNPDLEVKHMWAERSLANASIRNCHTGGFLSYYTVSADGRFHHDHGCQILPGLYKKHHTFLSEHPTWKENQIPDFLSLSPEQIYRWCCGFYTPLELWTEWPHEEDEGENMVRYTESSCIALDHLPL